jgi:hypothetical protein
LLLAPVAVQAGFITSLGTATFNAGNGSVVVNGNGMTNGCIDWYNGNSAPSCPQSPGTTANFTVNSPATTPFASGQTGTIQDLNFNTMFPVVDFIQIMTTSSLANPSGLVYFDLKDIRTNTGAAIGSCTPGTGDMTQDVSCTPAGSPFTLTNGPNDPNNGNVPDTVTISLTLDAYGYINSSGNNYDAANLYVGTFSTQTALSGTIDSILTQIGNQQPVSAAWSATFAPATAPEPSTFMTMGFTLLAAGYCLRRKIGKV